MPEDTLDVEHITDLAEKAEVIAEATNRRAEDVLADLLDDGQANMSAGIDAQRPDFLDKAQEQAEKLKSLLTTLIPIILMLGGVAAEGLGVLDLTSWGEESMWDEDPNNPNIYWGCMNQDATNYDEDANEDDESCIFPPDCNPDWEYEDNSRPVNDADILVAFKFYDSEDCDITINGHFIITLVFNGELYDEDTIDVGYFSNEVVITQEYNDLEDGTYEVQVELHELECKDGTCRHGSNWNMDHKTINIEIIIKGCMDQGANNYNPEATEDDGSCEFDPEECIAFFTNVGYQWENDTYGSVDLTVSFDADWSCEGEVSIGIDYYLKDKDGNEIQNESMFYETIGEQQDLKYFYSFSLSKPIDQSICLVLFYQDGDDWREDDEHNENLNL